MIDLWPQVPALLAANNYCVLATSDADGVPWATPVFFAASADHRELIWVSSADSRHSRNLAGRPRIAITVFDSTVAIGAAEAVYLEATVERVDAAEQHLGVFNAKLPTGRGLVRTDLAPDGPLTVYRATVERYFVLVRGGDQRFENVVDERREVHPPDGG